MRFVDKVILITGGATGIGRAAALVFGREGGRRHRRAGQPRRPGADSPEPRVPDLLAIALGVIVLSIVAVLR